MAYDDGERSDFGGKEVRLYQFQRGALFWRYCDADRDIPYGTDDNGQPIVYSAYAIQDDGLKQKGEVNTDDFTITVPNDCPLAQAFHGTPPSQPIKVMMRLIQYGDTEAPLGWTGYLSSVKFRNGESDLVCNTQVAYLSRKGLRLCYERACPHVLYDDDCGLDKALWAEQATVAELTGTTLKLLLTSGDPIGADPDRFTNGFLEWQPQAGVVETRSIQHYDGVNKIVQVLNYTDGLKNGMVIAVYPGCRRTPENCKAFNNIPNYGGFAFLIGRSPFDGNPVF